MFLGLLKPCSSAATTGDTFDNLSTMQRSYFYQSLFNFTSTYHVCLSTNIAYCFVLKILDSESGIRHLQLGEGLGRGGPSLSTVNFVRKIAQI